MESQSQIVVVGAGFAGLSAAIELHSRGFSVTVLEARSRLGGRVWSKKLSNGAIAELGGEWIRSEDKAVFRMASRVGQELAQIGIDFRTREVVNGPAVSSHQQRQAHRMAAQKLSSLSPNTISQLTVGEFLADLPIGQAQRKLLESRLQGSFGADLYYIALRMLGEYSLGENSEYFRLSSGNQSLAKAMAVQSGDVRLGHEVRGIAQNRDKVTIFGHAATAFKIVADAIVVAIPVKLLSKLAIDPPLPEKVGEAISSVSMGVAAKLAVGVRKQPRLFAIQDVVTPYWCWTGLGQNGVTQSMITAFCGSSQALRNLNVGGMDPTRWLSKLESALPGVDFTDDPIMVDWSQQEFSGGCYSAFDNKSADLIPHLSQSTGRLFFAGEHTDENSGTMDGAISSGLRAADQIIEVLR